MERERLGDVLSGAKVVILCVPSKVAPYVLPYLPREKFLIVATKGILSDKEFSEFRDWAVLSGPGFADDIKARKKTMFTVTDARVLEMFASDYVEFDATEDRRGVLMCGALKNVYAILAGLKGLERETAAWREFVREVAMEMQQILEFNGAEAKTVELACGVGDLKLTCGYPSRNYEYGDILRRQPDYEPTNTVEGLSAIRRIRRGEIKLTLDARYLKEVLNAVK